MEKRLKISFKKRSQTGWLMWIVIMLPCFFAFLVELLALPHWLRYSVDVAWVLLLVYILLTKRRKGRTGMGTLALLAVLFFVYTALTYIVQYQSIWYYLWGVRSNFRFFVAFFAFVMFLKAEDVTYYFKAFDLLFWVNVAVSLVQFFTLGLDGDHLGGIFGVEKGSNGYSVIFFVVMLTRSILSYLDKKESLGVFLWKSAAVLLIAALAELKFLFAMFLMIVVLATLFTSFTWRKFWLIVGGFSAVAVFAAVLEMLFPNFEGFLSWEYFLEAATTDKGYTSSGDMNRLNAIPIINEEWLTNGWERLFGMGLGNCDSAGYDFLVTPFHETYGHIHYDWFSYAFLYLETGWIGLAFYYGFFVVAFLQVRKIEKRSEGTIKFYCRMSRILSVCCVVLSIYNVALRTEAAYIMFFAIAIPFALDRENRKRAYLHDKKTTSEGAA